MSPVVSKSSQAVSRLKRKRDTSPDSADTSSSSSSSELDQTDDAPVLSHAARRKQKKKAASLKEAVPTKSPTKKQKKEGDASHSVKRQNSVWVGNLCFKTTPESLRRLFDGVGEITRVHLPTKLGNASPGEPARRENRGCVYRYYRLYRFAQHLTNKFRLCGLCHAGGEASRHHDVRVAIRRTPPFDQRWCVAPSNKFFFFAFPCGVVAIF